MIRNIIFDMGNVLLRFDPALFMERLGVEEADRPLLMREVYLSLEWSRMDRGSLTDLEAAEIMCRRVPERLHEVVYKLVTFWDRPILETSGVPELVRELKELGYGIYLLSNASLRQHEYWPRLSVSPYFDGTLVSADVKLVKPQPEIYLLLLSTFGLKADECFFIDDSTLNMEGAFFCGIPGAVFHQDVHELREKLRDAGVPVARD
jgi:putative hydrolase of the HAD superfamily